MCARVCVCVVCAPTRCAGVWGSVLFIWLKWLAGYLNYHCDLH